MEMIGTYFDILMAKYASFIYIYLYLINVWNCTAESEVKLSVCIKMKIWVLDLQKSLVWSVFLQHNCRLLSEL